MLKIISIFLLFIQLIYGYINIYPSFFYEELKKSGVTQTFVLTNRTDEEIRYRLYIEENILIKNDIEVEVYPKSITLSPFENKEVKLLIKPNFSLKDGLYKKTLVIKEVPIPRKRRKEILTEFKMNLGFYYGDVPLLLNFDLDIKKELAQLSIKNDGERVGILNIYRQNKKEEEFIDSFIVRKGEVYLKELPLTKDKQTLIIKDRENREIKKIILKGAM
ncbi:MAG: hypothetical protein ACRC92_06285 [Peptostreptococcaceae bacterium]